MKTVTVGKAKNELSALLRLVHRGESVLILKRNRPVARLEPVAQTNDDRLAELEREGIIKRATRKLPADFLSRPLPRPKNGTSVLATLLEQRAEGR